MKSRTILISDTDRRRLAAMLSTAHMDYRIPEHSLAALRAELNRARIVPDDQVPRDVVTMNSAARLCDLDTNEVEQYELVYPAHADMSQNRISILAPIGTAILGYRIGDVIEWPVPAGWRRLRVEDVYQPESACALQA